MSLDAEWNKYKLEIELVARTDIWEWSNKENSVPKVHVLIVLALRMRSLPTQQAWYLDWIISIYVDTPS